MSHALEQIQADRIGVICQIALSKLSTSCLRGYTVSATIHALLWKIRVEKEEHVFFGMASSVVLLVFRYGVETSNSVPEIHEYRPSSSCDALPADRRNKTLECILATLNVSSAIMSYALEQIQADGIGVICQIASSKLSTSCLHGYTVSFGKMQASSTLFWEAIFATPPTVLTATIHTLLWKILVEKKLFFWYGILPGSFSFQAWCGDFQLWGCISTKTLSIKRELLT